MTIPNTPSLALLPYSSEIKKAQSEVDQLYAAWVDEDEQLQDLNDELQESQLAYAVSFKKAAIAGAPIPDEASLQELEKRIAYQQIRAKHAKSKCEAAGRELTLLVRERRDEILTLAIEKARNGVELWQREVVEIAAKQIEAIQARNEALDGVRMLSYWGLTNEVIQFDPTFPIVGDFTVPSSHETRLLGFLDMLENTFRASPEQDEVVAA